MRFGDYLSQSTVRAQAQPNELKYWQAFVGQFFSPVGVLRQQLVQYKDDGSGESLESKTWEISTPALARYYWTHFTTGVTNIQMIMENASERDLANGGHFVESPKASFIYWYGNGCQVSRVVRSSLRGPPS